MNRFVRRATAALLITAGVLWIVFPALCMLAFGASSKDAVRLMLAFLTNLKTPFALPGLLLVIGGVILLFGRSRGPGSGEGG